MENLRPLETRPRFTKVIYQLTVFNLNQYTRAKRERPCVKHMQITTTFPGYYYPRFGFFRESFSIALKQPLHAVDTFNAVLKMEL